MTARFLVDTNVISEVVKKQPNQTVLNWLLKNDANLFISVITIEEMRFGVNLMSAGKKRSQFSNMIDNLIKIYEGKIFTFGIAESEECARLHALAINSGRTPTLEDLMIGAIAITNNLTIVTRNTRDFDYMEIDLLNPFEIIEA